MHQRPHLEVRNFGDNLLFFYIIVEILLDFEIIRLIYLKKTFATITLL